MNVQFSTFASLHWKECAAASLGVTLLVVGLLAHSQVGAFSHISQCTLPLAYTSYSLLAMLTMGVAIYSYRSWKNQNNPYFNKKSYNPASTLAWVQNDQNWTRQDRKTCLTEKSYALRLHPNMKLNKQTKLACEAGMQEQDKIDKGFRMLSPLFTPHHYDDLHAASSETIGVRDAMEDVCMACEIYINDKKAYLYGLFDGHGAQDASIGEFLKEQLPNQLSGSLKGVPLTHGCIADAFVSAYLNLDKDCRKQFPDMLAGATAISVLITDNFIYTANSGDSRAIFISDNPIQQVDLKNNIPNLMVQQLSEDAKPGIERFDRANEKADDGNGYTNKDGRVPRIMPSTLACAREIGFKDAPTRPKITRLPYQKGLLVMACDGLWDVASTNQVAQEVNKHKNENLANIAQHLVDYAYKRGSNDNISVLVIAVN